MLGFIGERCLWVRPCFSNSVLICHPNLILDSFRGGMLVAAQLKWIVGCSLQNLFKITRDVLINFLSSFFPKRFVSIRVVHPYSCSIDTTAAWMKFCFNLSDRSSVHSLSHSPSLFHSLSLSLYIYIYIFTVYWPFACFIKRRFLM